MSIRSEAGNEIPHKCFIITGMTQLCSNFQAKILKEKLLSPGEGAGKRADGCARWAVDQFYPYWKVN